MINIAPSTSRQRSVAFTIILLTCLRFQLGIFTCPVSINAKAQSSKKEPPSATGSKLKHQVDFTQADLMLDFLKSLAKSNPNPGIVDSILGAKGTELIIQQMNLARKVTREQYKQILSSLAEDSLPALAPADSGERAKRGVTGLQKEVWPALRWARGHTDILAERIGALRSMDLYNEAQTLALKYLPEPVDMAPSIFVVMGGRAGFAALEGDKLYYDILVMTYVRVLRDEPAIADSELIESFAHEMHHLGLAQIIESRYQALQLDEKQRRVFKFLSSLIEEGSASYLIDGHRDLDRMRADPSFLNYLEKTDELLNTCEFVLRSVLEGQVENDEAYDKVTASMVGHSYHSAGATMLSAIDRVQGLDAIMEILKDPRLLLTRYNDAAGILSQDSLSVYTFNAKLAEKVSALGH